MGKNKMRVIHIYSDESRHRAERFLLLGGLWIEEKQVSSLKRKITRLRNKHAYTDSEGEKISFAGEFKWTKVSDKYFQVYKDLVDLFFEGINKDRFRIKFQTQQKMQICQNFNRRLIILSIINSFH